MTEDTGMRRYHGKYRGVVEQHLDPLQLGRVQVRVPGVLGDAAAWAMPCVPFAGSGAAVLAVPAPGTSVWVEFEAGDPERPIWTGGFWPSPEEGPPPTGPGTMISGFGGVTVRLGKAVEIESAGGAVLRLDDDGITITTRSGSGVEIVRGEVRLIGKVVHVTDE